MTKSELQEALAKEVNLPLDTAKGIITTILDSMTDTLVNGDNVEIRGFGSYSVKHYVSYTGRNPKTGKEILVKAKKKPVFKVGKDLREAVNSGNKK